MSRPRTTRLVAVPTLAAYRQWLVREACHTDPFIARAHAILLPSGAAAEHLRRAVESASLPAGGAIVLPHLVTRAEWLAWLGQHVALAPRLLGVPEREVLLGSAAREAAEAGTPPPFSLRPALIADMLAFYDAIRRQLRTVDDFERLATTKFARDADEDLGAARLLQQARFMVAAFRGYEARLEQHERADEHVLRAALLDATGLPLGRVTVTVADRAAGPDGLWTADFDLLARLDGLASIDILATSATLAAGFRQRLHDHLPGLDESRWAPGPDPADAPVLVMPPTDTARPFHLHRDREDELGWAVRRIKARLRADPAPQASPTAIVFRRPLPYVYLAGRLFPSAGLAFETFDALPLASEPAAAALDLVLDCVATGFARGPLVTLLRSPHFRFEADGRRAGLAAVAQLDRALSEARYLAGADELARLAALWADEAAAGETRRPRAALAHAARAAIAAAGALEALRTPAPPSTHLDTLLAFVEAHGRLPAVDEAIRQRHLRARAAIVAAIVGLRDAHRAFDDGARAFDDTAAALRRAIERHTFAPRAGSGGVWLTDAAAARYAAFDHLYLVGLTQRDWPDVSSRNIFFPPSTLKDLGWPEDADARAADRALFADLLRAASREVLVSTFTLEDDAIVDPSPFLEDLAESGLATSAEPSDTGPLVFEDEALLGPGLRPRALAPAARAWLDVRTSRTDAAAPRFHGRTGPPGLTSYRVSSLDRYLECPFVFFAEQVLHLQEEPEDEESLSPRTQGRLLHEVAQAFFEAWQHAGRAAITAADLDEARARFEAIVEERLGRLPESDAAIERSRLLGSAAAPGLVEIVLGLEIERPAAIVERLLEFPLTGDADVRGADGGRRRLSLRATADRLDLFDDGTFRVIDYKLSKTPDTRVAVQLPAYAAAARARLAGHRNRSWEASDAAYVAFGKPPYYKPLAADPEALAAVLADGEARLVTAVDGIERGDFPPRPRTRHRCSYCPFAGVCRKDYVDDEA